MICLKYQNKDKYTIKWMQENEAMRKSMNNNNRNQWQEILASTSNIHHPRNANVRIKRDAPRVSNSPPGVLITILYRPLIPKSGSRRIQAPHPRNSSTVQAHSQLFYTMVIIQADCLSWCPSNRPIYKPPNYSWSWHGHLLTVDPIVVR